MIASSVIALGIYAATMKVTAIDNDVVEMETATGFVYEWEGADDYEVGDLVSLIMDSKGTEEIVDDEILSMRYAGWNLPAEPLKKGDAVTVSTNDNFHLNGQGGIVKQVEDNGNYVLVDFGFEECWFLASELR